MQRRTAISVWPITISELYSAAIEPLKKAIQLKPSLPEGHFNIGISYSRLKQNQEALTELQTTIQLKPDWAVRPRNNLGVAYGNLGKWKTGNRGATRKR